MNEIKKGWIFYYETSEITCLKKYVKANLLKLLKKIEVNSTVKGSFWKKLKSILQWKGVWKGNLLKKKQIY